MASTRPADADVPCHFCGETHDVMVQSTQTSACICGGCVAGIVAEYWEQMQEDPLLKGRLANIAVEEVGKRFLRKMLK